MCIEQNIRNKRNNEKIVKIPLGVGKLQKLMNLYFYFRIEEAKRAMKRPAAEPDRYNEIDRKRTSNDRRFEPPPPPRFDTAIRSSNYDRPPEKKRNDDYSSGSSKRNDDYKSSSRGNTR